MIVKDGYLWFEENDKIKDKKITGRSFVQLASKDSYTPKGDCIIKMFLRIKEQVNPYYAIRGDIAEKIVEKVLTKKGKKVVRYTTESEDYDMFKHLNNCGGVIDLRLFNDDGSYYIIETKSKEWNAFTEKRYKETEGNQNEIWQALYYQFLDKAKKSVMAYVLFNDNAKMCIENNLKLNPKDIKIFFKINNYDESKVRQEIQNALKYKKWCWENKKVPLHDISRKMLDFLIKEKGLKYE
jgi:hypothetical protein